MEVCRKHWTGFTYPYPGGVTMGTLRDSAKRHDPVSYAAAKAERARRAQHTSAAVHTDVMEPAWNMLPLIAAMRALPKLNAVLPLDDGAITFGFTTTCVTFSAGAVQGNIAVRRDTAVRLTHVDGSVAERFIGHLTRDFTLRGVVLASIEASIPPTANVWHLHFVSEDQASLSAPGADLMIYNAFRTGAVIKVDRGKTVKSKAAISLVQNGMEGAVERHCHEHFSITQSMFINNGTINIRCEGRSSRRSDDEVISMLMLAAPEFVERLRFSPSGTSNGSFFVCDPATCIGRPTTTRWRRRSWTG